MKDFISKVTFGFLMAQLLPGAVVVTAFTCMRGSSGSASESFLQQTLTCIGNNWFGSKFSIAAFLFVAVAVGMLIHGLNWTVLAFMENKVDPPRSVRETSYHRWPFIIQMLLSPGVMIYEVIILIFKAPNIEKLTMDENVNYLKEEYMEQFQFLEDFYLHFGQFYAHMAYAFLITLVFAIFRFFGEWKQFFEIVVILYLLTSLFFLLGRIQLGSLFKAESVLVDKSSKDEPSPEATD